MACFGKGQNSHPEHYYKDELGIRFHVDKNNTDLGENK